jgi:prefoldin subunit 5
LKGLEQTYDSVSRPGQAERTCRQVKQEIAMVDEEIDELEAENTELHDQLVRLDDTVHRRSGNKPDLLVEILSRVRIPN